MIIKENVNFLTLKTLIENEYMYKIPNFQRAYTWEKSNIIRLIDDLFKKGVEKEYYLGTIYTLKSLENSNDYFIIDGQQRITSFFLFLNAIRILNISDFISNIFSNPKTHKLDTYEGDPDFYKLFNCKSYDEVKETYCKDRGKSLTTAQLIQNQLIIIDYINETCKFDKESVLNLISNVGLISIEVKEEVYSHQIFENINSKGVSLSSVDIIKNRLFSKITSPKNIDAFKTEKYIVWKEIEDKMIGFQMVELNDLKNQKKIYLKNFDDMFKFYVQCIYKIKELTKTNYGIAEAYRKYLDTKDSFFDYEQELQRIKKYSEISKYIFYPKKFISNRAIGSKLNFYLKCMDTLSIKQHRIFSISIMKLLQDEKLKNIGGEVFYLCEKIVIFHYLLNTISSESPSKISNLYVGAAIKIYNMNFSEKRFFEIISEMMDSFNANCPEKQSVEANMKSIIFALKDDKIDIPKNDKKQYKVYKGKYYGVNLFKILESFFASEIEDIEIDTIEHVLSKSKAHENYENYKLYAMLPLESKLNGSAKSSTLRDKIKFYKKSDYYLTKKFVETYNNNSEKKDEFIVLEWNKKLVEIIYEVFEGLDGKISGKH